MNKQIFIVQIIALMGFSICSYAQSNNAPKSIISQLMAFSENHPIEKAYLQFDKPYYALGDTIWYKAYLLSSNLTASDKSRIINIDIADDSNKVIKQYRLLVQSGLGWGNISVDEKEFTTGTYTIRAYTNWMRNFGESYFFYKSFYVSSVNENNLLVNTRFNTSTVNGNDVLAAKLLFSDINKIPFAVKPLQLTIINGGKRLYKQKLQTDVEGILDVNFNIPQKLSGLAIVAESEIKDKRAVIPVTLNRPENIDIQFLPEGGSLVGGMPAHIGFKAIGENGKGIDVSGIITDHNQQQVAQFKSLHNGIGSLDLAVADGETYTAKVTLSGGMNKEYALSAVKSIGMVLKVKNPMKSDSVTVAVAASDDIVKSSDNYFLIGKARGIICYAAVFNFNHGNSIQKKITKSLFPTGITHFTVMTTKYQPLNERLVYIDHHDSLDIKFTTNHRDYHPRDSVALNIKVTDNKGNPVSGNFSLAVTDDTQVKTDSLNNESINTRLLLTSELKGYIEEPGYYLSSKTEAAWQALDNLLLTQGWIGYDWGQVFNPSVFAFRPELKFAVEGHVSNVFDKPVKGTDVLLFSKSPSILMDTVTDQNGKFIFDRFPKIDTPIFVLKAVNKNGKSFNVGITVEEVKPPDFIKPFSPMLMPWYVNSDGTVINYTKSTAQIKQQANFPVGGHILEEVKITANKIVSGSQNLNGTGNADLVLDEKDLEKEGKKNFLQLLEENIKGFRDGFATYFSHDRSRPNLMEEWYFINDKPIAIFVDGIKLSSLVNINPFINFKAYLQSHYAEDIKGIEVMSSAKYSSSYKVRFLSTKDLMSIDPKSNDFAYIEITTRSGHGPILDNTPGIYLYKPLPISWPKQFYKPKYTIKKDTNSTLLDLRSTINWEPNIVTDGHGEANLWFYTADKPSTYTMTIEGTDMNGLLGFEQSTIKIEGKEKAK